MYKRISIAIMLVLSISSAVFAQKNEPAPTGTPILWQEPTDIESRNLFDGPGGQTIKPDLSNVTFVRDQTRGFSTNWRVKDGAGKTWVAKISKEAQPETAAARILWALGYKTEINYLIPCIHIKGGPKGKGEPCEGDGIANVKLEARPEGVKRLESWAWGGNKFTGTNEFQGMLVLMSLINNWDLKDDNNKILFVTGEGGRPELHYIISDLGATFGKTGGFMSRNRNAPESFAKSKFVEGVDGNIVRYAYSGKNSGLFKNITVDQTKWIATWLSRLSEQQITDAFRAANYSPEEVTLLTRAMLNRIDQVKNLRG